MHGSYLVHLNKMKMSTQNPKAYEWAYTQFPQCFRVPTLCSLISIPVFQKHEFQVLIYSDRGRSAKSRCTYREDKKLGL